MYECNQKYEWENIAESLLHIIKLLPTYIAELFLKT